ncbi:hypothetical protein FRC20_010835 [Serendipita sp. 405]|nr:hypothetical protein FRC20_010835 [Serendipita sp. 405]
MPPRPRISCQICNAAEFKYTCASCRIVYCSVPCYKKHTQTPCGPDSQAKETSNVTSAQFSEVTDPKGTSVTAEASSAMNEPDNEELFQQPIRLRPLTSLKWPSIPPPPAIVDPLTINDPKPLQMPHYEAIATSTDIRFMLRDNPNLPVTLRHLDKLSGREREQAFEAILGVRNAVQSTSLQFDKGSFSWLPKEATEDDLVVLRTFAETLGSTINTTVLPAATAADPNRATAEQNQSSGGSMGLEIAEDTAH